MGSSEAVASVDVLLKINGVPIGGQLGATLTREIQTVDVTTKVCKGKREFMVMSDTWNVKCNGYYLLGDMGIKHLMDAVINYKLLDISVRFSEGYILDGKCLVETFPVEMRDKKEVVYSLTLVGSGVLEYKNLSDSKQFLLLNEKEEQV